MRTMRRREVGSLVLGEKEGVRVQVNLLPRKGRLGHPSEMAEVKRGTSLKHVWTQAGRGP